MKSLLKKLSVFLKKKSEIVEKMEADLHRTDEAFASLFSRFLDYDREINNLTVEIIGCHQVKIEQANKALLDRGMIE